MRTEYGSRLRTARKHAQLTQTALSKLTGIPQSTISTAEREGQGSGETPVYAEACGVDAVWLATGKGEMIPKDGQTRRKALTNEAQNLGEWLDKIKDKELHYRTAHAAMAVILRVVDGPDTHTTQPQDGATKKRRDVHSAG